MPTTTGGHDHAGGDQGERTIFDGVSFTINAGEIIDLVGPSGSGKSNLLTAFARLNPHAHGVYVLAGRNSSTFTPQQWRRDEIDTMLALGASAWEAAARPSIVSSIRLGLLPTTATLASCGIVTIPGMMAGQVFAGGDPLEAAKYQFVVFAAIAALTLVADGLIMTMVYRTCFTADDQYKPPSER
nr:ABC transporter permease [Bifidobacterium goeldii]